MAPTATARVGNLLTLPVPSIEYSVKREKITPEIAARYLATMRPNRNLRRPKANQYARDMSAGAWLENGDTIKFDTTGALIDGQHRLQALIAASFTFWFLVVRGVQTDAMATIDTGVGRKFADVLQITGHKNSAGVSATARWWLYYERGVVLKRQTVSHSELADVIARHPIIDDAVRKVDSKREAKRLIPVSALAFVYGYIAEHDMDAAELFLDSLDSGEALKEGDPVFALRRQLITNLSKKARMLTEDCLALVIKTFNYVIQGEQVRVVIWRRGGDSAETFPKFIWEDPKFGKAAQRGRERRSKVGA